MSENPGTGLTGTTSGPAPDLEKKVDAGETRVQPMPGYSSQTAGMPSVDYPQPGQDYGPPPQGYPPQGYTQQGYPPQGQGYSPQGYGYGPDPYGPGYDPNLDPLAKSKLLAGLLGIFLGGFGVHNFYLGFTQKGVIQIVVTLFTLGFGGLWGFVEGILYLTGSQNFSRDAQGRPLRQN